MKITKKPYTYLPQEMKVEVWDQVKMELKKLLEKKIDSSEELVNFINHYNELLDVVKDRDIQLWVQLSLDTTNGDVEKKGQRFTEKVVSKAKPYFFEIEKKILENPQLTKLDKRYDIYKKILTKNVKTYSEKNLPLQEKEQMLCEEYRRIPSTLTFSYEGKERTLGQMRKFLTNPNQKRRETAWRMIKKGWLDKKEELDQIFDQIRDLRNKMALNCEFPNFVEYIHLIRSRFGYSPEDFQRLHRSVEKFVIPALKKLNAEKRKTLQLDQLYPWDEMSSVYKENLQPFEDVADLVRKNERVLAQIDLEFAEKFKLIKEKGNLDLENRKGKVPGGFCFPIDQTRSCFICMNSVGLARDTTILIHESTHGIHAFAHADEPIREYRMFDSPGELVEFPCKAMELLALDYYDTYYDHAEDLRRAKRNMFVGVLEALRKYTMSDALEQWIYTHPNHSAEERTDYYRSLVKRFNPGVDWTDLDEEMSVGWYERFPLITMPAYIISYALAQLGAITVYKNYRENREKTIDQLKDFMKLGFSRSIDELFKVAGIKFDFSEEYLKEVVDFIMKELEIED